LAFRLPGCPSGATKGLAAAESSLKTQPRDQRDDEIERLKNKLGDATWQTPRRNKTGAAAWTRAWRP
jgi:hypothetical protein